MYQTQKTPCIYLINWSCFLVGPVSIIWVQCSVIKALFDPGFILSSSYLVNLYSKTICEFRRLNSKFLNSSEWNFLTINCCHALEYVLSMFSDWSCVWTALHINSNFNLSLFQLLTPTEKLKTATTPWLKWLRKPLLLMWPLSILPCCVLLALSWNATNENPSKDKLSRAIN